jgi:hypothetical protein
MRAGEACATFERRFPRIQINPREVSNDFWGCDANSKNNTCRAAGIKGMFVFCRGDDKRGLEKSAKIFLVLG